MIEIVLSTHCLHLLRHELRAAAEKEIGGVMAAEEVSDGRFLVADLSVQRDGSSSNFYRDPEQHGEFIRDFHDRMGHMPERFNYLGEWHSHPTYPALPSDDDFAQMQKLMDDSEQKSTFLVLMVVKLGLGGVLHGSVFGFRRGFLPVRGVFCCVDPDAAREERVPVFFLENERSEHDHD